MSNPPEVMAYNRDGTEWYGGTWVESSVWVLECRYGAPLVTAVQAYFGISSGVPARCLPCRMPGISDCEALLDFKTNLVIYFHVAE